MKCHICKKELDDEKECDIDVKCSECGEYLFSECGECSVKHTFDCISSGTRIITNHNCLTLPELVAKAIVK